MVRRLVMKRKRAVKEGGELFGNDDSDGKLSCSKQLQFSTIYNHR